MPIEELADGFKEVLHVLYRKYPQDRPVRWNETLDGFLFGKKGLYEMFKQQMQSALWGLEQRTSITGPYEEYRRLLIELIKQQNKAGIQSNLERLKAEYWNARESLI